MKTLLCLFCVLLLLLPSVCLSQEIIGKWKDQTPSGSSVFTIYKNNKGYYSSNDYGNGRNTIEKLKKISSKKYGRVGFNDYYVIDSNSNILRCYDKIGLVFELKPIVSN